MRYTLLAFEKKRKLNDTIVDVQKLSRNFGLIRWLLIGCEDYVLVRFKRD